MELGGACRGRHVLLNCYLGRLFVSLLGIAQIVAFQWHTMVTAILLCLAMRLGRGQQALFKEKAQLIDHFLILLVRLSSRHQSQIPEKDAANREYLHSELVDREMDSRRLYSPPAIIRICDSSLIQSSRANLHQMNLLYKIRLYM